MGFISFGVWLLILVAATCKQVTDMEQLRWDYELEQYSWSENEYDSDARGTGGQVASGRKFGHTENQQNSGQRMEFAEDSLLMHLGFVGEKSTLCLLLAVAVAAAVAAAATASN